jgi:DNA polymerase V
VAQQMSFFDILDQDDDKAQTAKDAEEKEKKVQRTLIDIKKKHGKNAIVKGMNLEEGATAMERNRQVGGHKA